VKGHKGHTPPLHNQASYSSIVFTSDTNVLSSSNSEVIQFNLNTNKFNVFPDFSSRNPITIMKVAPINSGIIAAGTKNGLILLINYESMNIVSKLRGHDMEITALDFTIYSPHSQILSSKESESKKPDDGDIFDIYSFEDVKNEFGVSQETVEDRSDDEESNEAGLQEKLHNTSNFNFLEECSTLKDTILSNRDGCEDVNQIEAPKKENFQAYRNGGENCNENPSIDFSIESNASSHTPALTEESLNFYEESQRMKDFVVVEPQENKEEENHVILASGSRECVVWLWSIEDQKPLHKIKWHPNKKSALPTIFTNVLWINAERLLVTDNNGDIIEQKIKFDEQTRGISGYAKQKRAYDARGVLNLCKSNDNRFLWTFSIHRNISCLEIETNRKIISLDTLQTRVHSIIENPIDSHVIAIGGNDKRLCLWNFSEATHHTIALKPFMH
jgi:WD40 repeat protein